MIERQGKAVLVKRELQYSGKSEDDLRILTHLANSLTADGFDTSVMAAEEFLSSDCQYDCDIVASMARGLEINATLQLLKDQRQLYIYNSPGAILASLSKYYTYLRMERASLMVPQYSLFTLEQNCDQYDRSWGKCIFKAAHGHDLWFVVENKFQFESCKETYLKKGHNQVIRQKFIDGMHVKFYGIFSLITFPGSVDSLPIALKAAIKDIAYQLRDLSGLQIFGGDLMVDVKNSAIYCLDVNDWPSFGTLPNFPQTEAASCISSFIQANSPLR